ncbi:MAG: hypothetical protein ABIR47_03570 [Candidatus Kapaibacterium sp.]
MGFLSSIFGRRKANSTELSFAPDIVITSDEQYYEAHTTGCNLIKPHMKLDDREDNNSPTARRDLVAGIRILNAVTSYGPDNWVAFWVKGKGYQAFGYPAAANDEFRHAFDLEKNNPDVAREFTISCLDLGLADDGLIAAEHAVSIAPANAGLHANLAVAFLMAGRLSDAQASIRQSLEMRPEDPISLAVRRVINEVAEGRRAQPRRSADLYKKI